MNQGEKHELMRLFNRIDSILQVLSHPDYTVGPGISPDLLTPTM